MTTLVGAASIAVTLGYWTGRDLSWAILGGESLAAEPWRAVTTVLPHANLLHLAFNVYWLWVLGTLVEGAWGWWRYALLLLLLGVGSMAAEHAVFRGGIGLSGIGYGLYGLLWVLARRDPRFVGAVDQATTTVFAAWFFVCILLTLANVMPVANVAHGAGALLGAMVGMCMRPMRPIGSTRSSHWHWRLATVLLLGAIGVGATIGRRWINPGGHAAVLFERSLGLLYRDHNAEAVPLLREAVEVQPDFSEAWHNLGLGYVRLDRLEDAVECARREFELHGGRDEATRQWLLSLATTLGQRAMQDQRWPAAARWLRQVAELSPERVEGWMALGLTQVEAGEYAEAERAFERAVDLDPAAAGPYEALEALRSRSRSIDEP